MNYKFETIMTWIMYVKNNIWKVKEKEDYKPNPEIIRDKFEALFQHELLREFNDCNHSISGLYAQVGTITVFVNPDKHEFNVSDNYNNLMSIYNGIYNSFDGKKLCLNTKRRGFKWSYHPFERYFVFREEEDDTFVFVESIVNGTCKSNAPNVRRLISLLFSRSFNYLESTNPEAFMFMDYSDEEKEEIIKECEQYDKRINKKKAAKKVSNEEE